MERQASPSPVSFLFFSWGQQKVSSGSAACSKEEWLQGTTALTKMVQDLGRTMSLIQPFLEGCSKSTSVACF